MTSPPPQKIALVTGASSGIGRASAISLSQAGWTVVISGRRSNELDETIRLAKEGGADVKLKAVPGDLSKPEDIDALFETIKSDFGAFSPFPPSTLPLTHFY
jgi:NAD(P)-dependent dehydrogenase (short-subunit alcohol dehydrogenase family)